MTPDLSGWRKGLYGEVVDFDCYKLRDLTWQPDIVLDLGANIGIFARFARSLFPAALIVSVEPDPDNYHELVKYANDTNHIFINKAIGTGQLWHITDAVNGSDMSYFSADHGFTTNALDSAPNTQATTLQAIQLDSLMRTYVKPNMRSILKCDIEGNEHSIFVHKPSLDALKTIDYIVIELHYGRFAPTSSLVLKDTVSSVIEDLSNTHTCIMTPPLLYATKKARVHV